MKTIDTLIKDVEELLETGLRGGYEDTGVGERLAKVLERRLEPRDEERATRVWFSNVGSPCIRQLWYKINTPAEAEPLRANTLFKFLYGDYLEEVFLELARLAGHLVEHEQRRAEWRGVTGRIDAVIDGVPVDVKSASKFSFSKFKGGLSSEDDKFGYLGQLKGYLLSLRQDGIVAPDYNKAAFLAINKETGDLHLDMHEFDREELEAYDDHIDLVHSSVALDTPDPLPRLKEDDDGYWKGSGEARHFIPNGNKLLCTNCSYCAFKQSCWPKVRVFINSQGKPKFFTKIVKEPRLTEVEGW